MNNYETIIGLEVHAQLSTVTKMFCGCRAVFGAAPNTATCPVCQGMPGSLPFINRRAVEFGIMTALAIGCEINAHNRFARKHYYYPDMPKNYQISQYEEPLAEHGRLAVDAGGGPREIGIQRVHLEEDVGKLVHEGALEQRGLQPGRGAPDGDRLQARPPEPGGGRRLPEDGARDPDLPARVRRQ